MCPFLPTTAPSYRHPVAIFEVTLRDRTVQTIGGVDAYRQEGPMTTFFRTGPERRTIDSWSARVASVCTADVLLIRLAESEHPPPRAGCHPVGSVAG